MEIKEICLLILLLMVYPDIPGFAAEGVSGKIDPVNTRTPEVFDSLCHFLSEELELIPGNYKTIHYDLHVELNYDAKLLSGSCSLSIENNSDEAVNKIPLLLYKQFDVSSIRDSLHNPLSFSQEVVPFIDWPEYIVKHIVVDLPEPLQANHVFMLDIEYAGTLSGNLEAQSYVPDHISEAYTVIRNDSYAFPMRGVPVDREMMAVGFSPTFDYTIHVTVPKGKMAVNTGCLDSLRHTGDQSTYSFSNMKKTWRMDVSIADYSVLEIEDANLRIFYFPEDSAGARDIADHYGETINFYKGLYGQLSAPEQFTIIEVPSVYGSQADVSGMLFQSKNFEPGSGFKGFYHELSHQWDPVENGELHMRWNEGLAEFHQYYLLQELGDQVDALHEGFEDARGRFIASVQNKPENKDIPFCKYGTEGDTDLSYLKGMMFFTVLYHYLGEGQFFNMIKSYFQKYFIPGVSLEEFVAHLKAYGGLGMDRIIEEWIFDTRSNKYIFDGLPAEEIAAHYKKQAELNPQL